MKPTEHNILDISEVTKDGAGEREGTLSVSDLIISINGLNNPTAELVIEKYLSLKPEEPLVIDARRKDAAELNIESKTTACPCKFDGICILLCFSFRFVYGFCVY